MCRVHHYRLAGRAACSYSSTASEQKTGANRKNGNRRRNTRRDGVALARIPRASGLNGGFPERIKANLKYVELFTLAGTSTIATRPYGLNCLWDPYLGVGGHQPSNFDNWTRIYGFYTVYAASFSVTYFNDATGSSQPAAYGYVLSYDGNSTSTSGTVTYMMEQPHARYSPLPSGIVNAPVHSPLTATHQIAPWFGGVSAEDLLTQSQYRGTSSTNPPTIGPYLEVWHGSSNGATTGTFSYKVEIDFHVVWSNPLPTLPS